MLYFGGAEGGWGWGFVFTSVREASDRPKKLIPSSLAWWINELAEIAYRSTGDSVFLESIPQHEGGFMKAI